MGPERRGRSIGRIEPVAAVPPTEWSEIMAEVWQAQKEIQARNREPNPVLKERNRRRR